MSNLLDRALHFGANTYIDTRGKSAKPIPFTQAVVDGLAPGGGLFVPQAIPHMSVEEICQLSALPYQKRAAAIYKAFNIDMTDAEIDERIKVAREFGDISENSEYDDAKNEQGMMEARIAEITRILSEATVVSAPKRSSKVTIGSSVTVKMNGAERVLTIVGAAESDAANGKISNESPIGAALLGHKKGETFTVTGPTGKSTEIEVIKIVH